LLKWKIYSEYGGKKIFPLDKTKKVCYSDKALTNPFMIISRDQLADLQGMQEDMASHFTDENFPISGETYWTCVQALAEAKLAELRGELIYEA